MRIAVSGANGFVGRAVLAQLEAAGHEAFPLVRTTSGLPGEVVIGDIGQEPLPSRVLQGVEGVIHLAARTHVLHETAMDPLTEYRKVNVAGTERLLDAAVASGIGRFVFMSSVKAVGEWSLPDEPLSSASIPRPEDPYGITKLEAEQLVRQRCEMAGIEWAILRPPLVYGPGVKANFERLVRIVAGGIPLPFGAIDNRRSFVGVASLADAAVRAATIPSAKNKVFMICDVTLSTPQLIRQIASALGRPARLLNVPPQLLRFAARLTGRKRMAERLVGSLELECTTAQKDLEWQPLENFDETLANVVREMGYSPVGALEEQKS